MNDFEPMCPLDVQYDISKVGELVSHQQLRHVVRDHVICRTVLYLYGTLVNLVHEEEIFYM